MSETCSFTMAYVVCIQPPAFVPRFIATKWFISARGKEKGAWFGASTIEELRRDHMPQGYEPIPATGDGPTVIETWIDTRSPL